MAKTTGAKRTENVVIRTTLDTKQRLEDEAKRRDRPTSWVTEQCWEAYLPIMEAEKIEKPKFPKQAKSATRRKSATDQKLEQ